MLHAPNRFIRRKVLAIVDEDAAYAAESLAREIFPGDERLTRAQLNAVRRAMHALVRKYPGELVLTGGKGREPLCGSGPILRSLIIWRSSIIYRRA